MSLVLTEDQEMLKSTARDFVRKESPVSRVRRLRDTKDPLGFSRDLWSRMAELGWQAILVPEAYGGLGRGYADMACVLEECGRNLVPEPLLSTCLLGANAIVLAGSEAQKAELLPQVADGSLLLALAHQERGARFDVFHCETRAERSGTGYLLSGEKTLVLDGHAADRVVVVARTEGDIKDRDGLTMLLVDRETPGIETVPQSTMHLRNAAVLRFSGAEIPRERLLGAEGGAGGVLERVIDRATLGVAAELLGNMQAAFEMTRDYLKTRKQFGVPIGSFQALKHRAATVFIEIELARSAVLGAASAIDADAPNARELVSLAKARCSDAGVLAGYEAIQMHGGIGMTDEHDIGFYAKRMRGSELTFGDAAYHRDRYASLQGY